MTEGSISAIALLLIPTLGKSARVPIGLPFQEANAFQMNRVVRAAKWVGTNDYGSTMTSSHFNIQLYVQEVYDSNGYEKASAQPRSHMNLLEFKAQGTDFGALYPQIASALNNLAAAIKKRNDGK